MYLEEALELSLAVRQTTWPKHQYVHRLIDIGWVDNVGKEVVLLPVLSESNNWEPYQPGIDNYDLKLMTREECYNAGFRDGAL